MEETINNMMKDWCKLIENQKKEKEDVYSIINLFPQYVFKNLIIKNPPIETSDEIGDMTINFIYEHKIKNLL